MFGRKGALCATMTVARKNITEEIGGKEQPIAGVGQVEPVLSPSRLAARAFVEGYPVRALKGASYLEIGCENGANLIAQAAAYPQVSFTGTTPDQGPFISAFAHEANLKNVNLIDLNLSGFETKLGSYDFVVAHNVFSAASTAEQMALLVLIHRHLAEGGIACVGLDVKPEGNGSGHFEQLGSREEAQGACETAAFIAMAQAAKLQLIGDMDPLKTNATVLPMELRHEDKRDSDLTTRLRAIDRYANISHRHVLLCHADREKETAGLGKVLDELFVTSTLSRDNKELSDADLLTAETVLFNGPVKYQTSNRMEIVALALMERNSNFPVRAGRLVGHVATALRKAGIKEVATTEVGQAIAELCNKLLPMGALITHQAETNALYEISDRPCLAPLALLQLRRGFDSITSLTPHRVAIDDVAKFILNRFDGLQTRQQITGDVVNAVKTGEIKIPEDVATPQARANATVLKVLIHATRNGLLVS